MGELVYQSFINEHFAQQHQKMPSETMQHFWSMLLYFFIIQEAFLYLFIFLHSIASNFMYTGFTHNTFF